MADIANVIRNAKSYEALGPEGTVMIMLKQLETPEVLNMSLATYIVIEA